MLSIRSEGSRGRERSSFERQATACGYISCWIETGTPAINSGIGEKTRHDRQTTDTFENQTTHTSK